MGKKEELEGTPLEPEVEPELEPQPKTYTQEELDALLGERDKAYQGIQRVVSQKDRKIRELEAPRTQPSKATKVILEEMEARQTEEGITNPRIAQLRAEIAREEQAEGMETITREWRGKITDKIVNAGLDPSDEAFDDVWESFDVAYAIDGKFERADKKADRILAKVKPVEKKETKPEDFDKRLEEEKRKWMEEQGLLATDTGGPSAGAKRWEEVRDRYIENPDDLSNKREYLRLRYERGL